MKKTILILLAITISSGTILTSCTAVKNTNKTQRGAGIGAVAGGIIGGVLGNNLGGGGKGAMGAAIGAAVGGTAGGLIGRRMDRQARQIQVALPAANVVRVGDGIRLVLGENSIRFDTNKSVLNTISQTNLDKLVPVLNEYADTDIVISGYTDSSGNSTSNQKLSEQRALAVKTYLSSKGINTSRFTVVGMGMADPIASNDTAEGKSQNRRVEFAITAKQ